LRNFTDAVRRGVPSLRKNSAVGIIVGPGAGTPSGSVRADHAAEHVVIHGHDLALGVLLPLQFAEAVVANARVAVAVMQDGRLCDIL